MKHTKILLTFIFFIGISQLSFSQGTATKADSTSPPTPIEGTCYARSETPDKFIIEEKQKMVEEAKTQEKYIPAEYDTIRQQVLIRQSYDKMVTYEAEFDTIMMEVQIKDKSKVIEEKYRTVFEADKINTPKGGGKEKGRWQTIRIKDCNSPNPKDCEMRKWVADKSEYNITTKEVFIQASWADTVESGATVKIPKIIQTKPARIEKIFVPAEYETIEKVALRKHARRIMVEIPPKYKTVKTKKLIEKGGKPIWVEVMCPASLNEIVISQVQLALKGRKVYKGAISGVLDKSTLTALEKFQKDNSLPVGKLNKQTIEALGFNYSIFKKPMN
ncbi:MAG: peptidoglycan-binding domain-containing protein [Saprospiraceae bacterium]